MKRTHNKAAISDELKKILVSVAELLEDYTNGKYIDPARVFAHSMTLRRIVDPPVLRTAAEELEMMVAITYAIRKELLGKTRGNAKKARAETADIYHVTEATVSTFASRWEKEMDATIEKIVAANSKYHGLDRAETLTYYLREIESLSGQNLQQRKVKRNRSRVV